MGFDADVEKQIDAVFTEQLTQVERKFISGRADGLSLGAAWSCAGYEYYSGWQRDARDLERRLVKRRRAIEQPYREQMKAVEQPYREQMKAVERAHRERMKAVEWARHRERTAPLRAKLCAGLWAIITADAGAAVGEDGKLDVGKLKASGLGPAIQRVRVGADGRLESIQLHNKVTAARLIEQLA